MDIGYWTRAERTNTVETSRRKKKKGNLIVKPINTFMFQTVGVCSLNPSINNTWTFECDQILYFVKLLEFIFIFIELGGRRCSSEEETSYDPIHDVCSNKIKILGEWKFGEFHLCCSHQQQNQMLDRYSLLFVTFFYVLQKVFGLGSSTSYRDVVGDSPKLNYDSNERQSLLQSTFPFELISVKEKTRKALEISLISHTLQFVGKHLKKLTASNRQSK